MSFRDNLQHLRATRGMTQEQLAMLLGVSRQSVTKWESERTYPEMDKLLKMCQVFDCTLDELVQGDLTARTPMPAAAGASAVPHVPQDVCGYDEHRRSFSVRIATGVAVILWGLALAFWLGGVLTPESTADVAFIACVFAGIVAGLALIIPSALAHGSFVRAHPFVEDFYTVEQRDQGRRSFAFGLIIGIALVFAAVIACAVLEEREMVACAALMALLGAGVWLIVASGMRWGMMDIEDYNKDAGETLTDAQIDAVPDPARREALRRAKRSGDAAGAVCGVIMLLATAVGLVLLFVPAVKTSYFWLAWAIGGLLCGVAAIVMKAIDDARR